MNSKLKSADARAVHVIPYDGIGGVESAARSLKPGLHDGILFSKYFISNKQYRADNEFDSAGSFESENDPRAYLHAAAAIRKLRPGIVIASLWRSCMVAILLKFLSRDIQLVTFVHSAFDVHLADKFFNRLAMMLSSEVWVDSQATLQARVPKRLHNRAHIISFLIERHFEPVFQDPQPNFVFWGRLHGQKGLMNALELFSCIKATFPQAKYDIIGPDGGERKRLEQQIRRLGLETAVRLRGPMSRADIFNVAHRCSFYLQTSLQEGMAMSVMEAMQLGLVPIVAPVGEIGRYCQDGKNAILIYDDAAATVGKIGELMTNRELYKSIARAGFDTWNTRPLYRDDVIAGCKRILQM